MFQDGFANGAGSSPRGAGPVPLAVAAFWPRCVSPLLHIWAGVIRGEREAFVLLLEHSNKRLLWFRVWVLLWGGATGKKAHLLKIGQAGMPGAVQPLPAPGGRIGPTSAPPGRCPPPQSNPPQQPSTQYLSVPNPWPRAHLHHTFAVQTRPGDQLGGSSLCRSPHCAQTRCCQVLLGHQQTFEAAVLVQAAATHIAASTGM